jgi:membrane-associated phospholipid phosphatase
MPDERPDAGGRAGVRAGLAVGLGLLAAAALWAGFTGVGPAQLDGPALAESIEDRSTSLTTVAVVVTTIGSTVAMAVLATVVGAWLWWRGRRMDAVLTIGAMAGASFLFRVLKLILERARPPVADHVVPVSSESLPSGHATMSTVVIGTMVALAWSGRSVAERAVMVAAAALWIGAVGATRVYLGVHWLSDVLAGWAVGAAWLAVCLLVWTRWRARQPQQ